MESIPADESSNRTVLYNAVQYSAVHYSAVQRSTVHYPIFKRDVLSFNSSSTSHFTKCI